MTTSTVSADGDVESSEQAAKELTLAAVSRAAKMRFTGGPGVYRSR
jgi:hypothetical protein